MPPIFLLLRVSFWRKTLNSFFCLDNALNLIQDCFNNSIKKFLVNFYVLNLMCFQRFIFSLKVGVQKVNWLIELSHIGPFFTKTQQQKSLNRSLNHFEGHVHTGIHKNKNWTLLIRILWDDNIHISGFQIRNCKKLNG